MVCLCFYAHVLYFDFFGKFKLTHYPGVGGRDAVAVFFVSLGRQWCCGGDTLGRAGRLERKLRSKAIYIG